MAPETTPPLVRPTPIGLKKVQPYWYPYTTMAKLRWQNRELLEVVSTEFRDRSMEYYRYALESGVTTINGQIAGPKTLIKNGDRIENIVHRHEPPVTSTPIKILHHDVEREFIVVDKPGSIPIHSTGRYYNNTLIEILQNEFGFKTYPVNRLDRLTSGLMILPLSSQCAKTMAKEFEVNTVHKEYVTRCKGEFPEEEIVCEEPLITIDRQMGLNIVHPDGKPAKTVFKRIRYDANTDSSVILCKPFTGRSHQIRVHLQFLGYPVANDPVYSETRIWGEGLGKGGLDTTPTEERIAPAPPPHLELITEANGSPESLTKVVPQPADQTPLVPYPKPLPRETGEDIGMGSPVPLSGEAVGVITRLRNMKDEEEDWGRWRDVVFRAKGALAPTDLKIKQVPQNQRRRGRAEFVNEKHNLKRPFIPSTVAAGPAATVEASLPGFPGARIHEGITSTSDDGTGIASAPMDLAADTGVPAVPDSTATRESATLQTEGTASHGDQTTLASSSASPSSTPSVHEGPTPPGPEDPSAPPPPPQFTVAEALQRASEIEASMESTTTALSESWYCPECYLPLHPDPKPEKLYIFLHALRYTTSLGTFETPMPEWAQEGWEWDRS
ncbi:pseudouridine synthase [Mycena maculata]|uniref:Pseudouridine synthase n=1 Tax=Mycena maculata TaxID=230809 RepID=A0AAD7ITA9_9AGAR|nr:pseudouridine synthase [Mycena maculata]